MAEINAQSQVQICPKCRNILPVIRGYSTWCERCHWNIIPEERVRKPSWFAKLMEKVSLKVLSGMYQEARSNPKQVFHWSITNFLASLLSVLVLLVTLVFWGIGLIFAYFGLFHAWPFLVPAAILLAFGWGLRPRFSKIPASALSPSNYPQLFQLIQEVSTKFGTRVEAVAVYEGFTFAIQNVSWKQKKVLWIGLPFWEILTKEERIAALAQVFGLTQTRTSLQKFLIGTARYTLDQWSSFFRIRARGWAGIILLVLYLPVVLAGFLMNLLICRTKQRTVFYADLAAARVAGTQATIRMVKKLSYESISSLVVQRHALNTGKPGEIFAEITKAIADTPQREFLRLDHMSRMVLPQIDSDCPPDWIRMALLDDQYNSKPEITISDERMDEIEAELAGLKPAIGLQLMNNYQDELSRW